MQEHGLQPGNWLAICEQGNWLVLRTDRESRDACGAGMEKSQSAGRMTRPPEALGKRRSAPVEVAAGSGLPPQRGEPMSVGMALMMHAVPDSSSEDDCSMRRTASNESDLEPEPAAPSHVAVRLPTRPKAAYGALAVRRMHGTSPDGDALWMLWRVPLQAGGTYRPASLLPRGTCS